MGLFWYIFNAEYIFSWYIHLLSLADLMKLFNFVCSNLKGRFKINLIIIYSFFCMLTRQRWDQKDQCVKNYF